MLEEPPLEAGQQREVVALIPLLNQACTIRVEGLQTESGTLLDGSEHALLKTRYITELPQQTQEDTAWLNEAGEIVKQFSPTQQLEFYRCPKQFALTENRAVYDLAVDSIVPVDGNLPDLRKRDQLTYRVTLARGNPAQVFPSRTNQLLTPIDEQSARLKVWRVGPATNLPASIVSGDEPTEDDMAASPLVLFTDPAVQELARQVALSGQPPEQKAIALEAYVHRTIQEKNFSRGFLSASDVARQKAGDCTEHAVLLMALLRAHDIPSRAALGLVYVDHEDRAGFAYHMWTEAWVGDRWIPLDATRGEGGIGVQYIKVTQSSLHGAAAFAAFLPVSQVIGQLQIEVDTDTEG